MVKEEKQKEEVKAYQPPIPFPQRLKQSKMDGQYAKFLNVFKKLEINIPFAEALAQMPHYVKFMKDIINKKRKLDEEGGGGGWIINKKRKLDEEGGEE